MKKKLKNILKDQDRAKFRILTGLKFAIIPILSLLFLLILSYVILAVSLAAMDTFHVDKSFILHDLVKSFISHTIVSMLPWVSGMFVILFIIGLFIGSLMLRPFKNIAEYCENRLNGIEESYDPLFSTDLKLLNSFAEWFFLMVEDSSRFNQEIPVKFRGIHKPVFEKNFFLYNFLIIIIVTILTAITIHYLSLEMFEDIVEVVNEVFSTKNQVTVFTSSLYRIFFNISNLSIAFNVVLYMAFMFHIYSKVSTPAFGIFATMRSFIMGKRESRVHLIGYTYIRSYTRTLNKYLDQEARSKD